MISYGPRFIQVGQQLAPAELRFVQTQPDDPENPSGPREWVLEASFQAVQGLWLLDEATNSPDGKRVGEIKISDVSVLPIPDEKFATTTAPDKTGPTNDE